MPATSFWKGELETADPGDRERLQVERLGAFVERVHGSSPLVRGRLDAAGVRPGAVTSLAGLRAVPPISKPELIADQAAAPPFGTVCGVDPEEIVRLYVGPGPQTTYFTGDDFATAAQDAAWVFWTNGFRATDLVDVTINYHWVIAGTLMDEGYRLIGCATLPGGIGMTQLHIETLRWTGATGLFAFPTFLEELAKKAAELDVVPARDLRLRVCSISGEMRREGLRDEMEEFWGGMRVRELYGGAEVPFIAAECEAGSGMHLNPDLIVELLHPETREPVAPGEPGVVVGTDTRRRAYPMLRYWTGDVVAGLDPDPCPCGRTTPRLGRVLGRVGDIPRVKGLFVVPKQVAAALEPIAALGRFQLVVDRPATQDVLTVVVQHAGDPGERRALADEVVRRLKETIRLTCIVDLVDPGHLSDDAPLVDDRRTV